MLLGNLIISGRDAPDPRRQAGCRRVPTRGSWATLRGLEFTLKLCGWLRDLVEITEGGGKGGCAADAGEVVLMRGTWPAVGRG